MFFKQMQPSGFEQVVFCQDDRVGLRAIISIHSSVLGPATGGCRMWNYGSEAEAVTDVLRLSEGMTYKAAMAGLDWGGGKAVILGDAKTEKTPALLQRFGEFVDRLGGHYITAKDVGIGADDLRQVKKKTQHVLGIEGDEGSSGDPSPATAWGVFNGMQAAAQVAFGARSLKGLKIAIQGLGSVSNYLLEYLVKEEAQIVGCDIDAAMVDRAVKKFGIEIVQPDAIYDVKCDIFSPSALGSSVNAQTLPRIQAKVIAGGANNQLATLEEGYELMRRGMVYAPDYVINGGGLVNIYYEDAARGGYSKSRAFDHVAQIGQTVSDILERSQSEKTPSQIVANRMAEERIEKKRKTIS